MHLRIIPWSGPVIVAVPAESPRATHDGRGTQERPAKAVRTHRRHGEQNASRGNAQEVWTLAMEGQPLTPELTLSQTLFITLS